MERYLQSSTVCSSQAYSRDLGNVLPQLPWSEKTLVLVDALQAHGPHGTCKRGKNMSLQTLMHWDGVSLTDWDLWEFMRTFMFALAKHTHSCVLLCHGWKGNYLFWRGCHRIKRTFSHQVKTDHGWKVQPFLDSVWDGGMLWWSTNLMNPDLMSSGCARWAALLDKGSMIAPHQMKIKMEVNVAFSISPGSILSPAGLGCPQVFLSCSSVLSSWHGVLASSMESGTAAITSNGHCDCQGKRGPAQSTISHKNALDLRKWDHKYIILYGQMLLSRQLPWPEEINLMHVYDTPLLKHHSYEHSTLLYSFDFLPKGEDSQVAQLQEKWTSNTLSPDFCTNVFCSRAGKP